MKTRSFVLLSTALMFTATAFGQKYEIYGDYSYMQFNTTIKGTQSRAFNGGGGGVQFNLGKNIGIRGDFQGYGSTQVTMNVTSPISTSAGIIPVGTYKSNFNMFTYLFGPVVGVQAKRVKVYGDLLFGGSNTNGYTSLLNQVIVGGEAKKEGTQHPFTMAFGGGVDVSVNKNVSLRLGQMEWLITRFTNPLTQTNNQNSFRYTAGIVIKFGGI